MGLSSTSPAKLCEYGARVAPPAAAPKPAQFSKIYALKFVDAEEAKDIGLVLDVFDDDQLMEKTLEVEIVSGESCTAFQSDSLDGVIDHAGK